MEMAWLPCLMMFSFLILSEGRTIKKRGKFCHYDGTNFEEGNEIITHDRCETCKCEDGKPICSLNSGCSGCRYAGNHYEPGDEFEDGCQDCVCQEGGKVNCEWRKYCNSRREVLDAFGLLRAKLGTVRRSLVNGRQEKEERATGRWVQGTWYDVGDTFGGDGCTSAKCTCHWDGSVSCHQGGTECENAIGEDCWYNGGFVSHGEVVPDRDGCGTCACVDGNMACDNSGCEVERGCWYGGSSYEQGDWFDLYTIRVKSASVPRKAP